MHKTSGRTPPSVVSLDSYKGRQPYILQVDITEDTIMDISGQLSGGARTGGGIGGTATLAPDMRGSKRGFVADCDGLRKVARKRTIPLGCLPVFDE